MYFFRQSEVSKFFRKKYGHEQYKNFSEDEKKVVINI